MKKTNKAFSIIEVVTASIILAIAVFGVFKLIGENQKILNNSEKQNTTISLFPSFIECIKNKSSNSNVGDNKTFYIKLENCDVEPTTKTGITLDNIDYTLYGSGIGNNSYDLYVITDDNKEKINVFIK